MAEYLQLFKKPFEEDTPQNAKKASADIGEGANGVVTVTYDYVGTIGNNYSISISDENDGEDDEDLVIELDEDTKEITVVLGTDGDSTAHASIGSGDDGTINITLDETESVEGNTYTVAVENGLDGGSMSAALVGTDITVTLGMTSATAAEASIGSGVDGTVDISVDEAGAAGNDYTVEVVTNDVEDQDLTAELTNTALVVTLGNNSGDSAVTVIGSGVDGSVDIEVDAAGSAGNAFTVAVIASLDEQDRPLTATLTETDLVVELATVGNEPAHTYIGSGSAGTVYIYADEKGTDANSYIAEVDADITGAVRPLGAALVDDNLVVSLAVEGTAKASTSIGSGEDSTLNIEVDEAGAEGNSFTVEVIAGSGVLDVSLDNYTLVVTLAAGGSTPQAIAAEINNNHGATFTATATGTGLVAITEAEAEKNFTGGESQLKSADNLASLVAAAIQALPEFSASCSGDGSAPLIQSELRNFTGGTNRLATSSNTATLVAGAINAEASGILTATASGTGNSSLTVSEAQKNFTGGGANVALDAAKNTATLVAEAINTEATGVLTATASGTGNDPLTDAEAEQSFTGGTDSVPDDAKNLASLIATEIDNLAGISAEATGDGSAALDTEESHTFTGDTDSGDISAIKNTAALIASAINDTLADFTAEASGDGSTAIVTAAEAVEFEGGQYATEAKDATLIIIDGTWYYTEEGCDRYAESAWYSGTPSTI
jgi:hypothetical protein